MISRLAVGLGVVVIMAAQVPAAAQQQTAGFRPRHFIVSGGVLTAGSYQVGDVTATLRRNTLGTPPPFTLFRAESELRRATGVEGRVNFAFTRAMAVEVGGAYANPELGVTITQDAETSGAVSARERVEQFVVDVSGVYQLPIAFGRRMQPYGIAGAGYLRHLHEGRILAQTGHTIHAGGGVHFWMRGLSARERPIGVRAEARYVRRSGGVEFNDRARGYPTLSVLLFAGL